MINEETQMRKIPISLIRQYMIEPQKAKKQFFDKKKSQSVKAVVGSILHIGFKIFHEYWMEELWGRGNKEIGINLLTMTLDVAEEEAMRIMYSHPRFLDHEKNVKLRFERMVSGKTGFKAKINEAARKVSKGNVFKGTDVVISYFKGEPFFEYELFNDSFIGVVDVLVEKEATEEFEVWELKTGSVPDAPLQRHIYQAAGYAIIYEEISGKVCTGLRLLYLGELDEPIPFTDNLRTLIKEKFEEMESYFTEPIEDDQEKVVTSEFQDTLEVESIEDIEEVQVKIEVASNESVSQIAEVSENVVLADDSSETLSVQQPITSPPKEAPVPVSEEKEGEEDEDKIGVVIQNEKAPLILSLNRDNQLNGAIKAEFQNMIHPGQVLIADINTEPKPCAVVEVREITSFPKIVSSIFLHFDTFNIYLKLFPFMYYKKGKDKYTKILYPEDFSTHYLRLPSQSELQRIMNLFTDGIPLGLVTYEILEDELPTYVLPYYFPFSMKEIGYKGMFVVGSPGKGKTNLLKILIDGISHYIGTPSGEPPALIVLDITGQFGELERPTQESTVFDEKVWKIMDNLRPPKDVKYFKMQYDHGDGTHTLALNNIDSEMITLLFPELPPTSTKVFQRHVKEIFQEYPAIDFEDFEKKIQKNMDSEGDILNVQVKRAILGAIKNGPKELFDQGGVPLKVEQLIVPGQVSVIQVNHIQNPLPVLLYILMMINKRKIFEEDMTPTILMVDEAHELFPRVGGNTQNYEYIKRISRNLISIARRGRKKHFGLVFASQQPKDIIPEIIGVFQTQIIMGLESTSADWIKDEVGREYVGMVLRLPRGYARIKNTEVHSSTLVPLYIPRAPNKHEEE